MSGTFMIYGATGYTGKLTARMAAQKGLKPILAGRSAAKLQAVAEPLGLEWAALSLDRPKALDKALADVDAVLHIAGPFSATSKPMLDACLRTKTHYLDITGEIDVFEACAARDAEARKAGIMVLPGVGFDVVPSDCLAAHMKRRMPEAQRLEMGIAGMSNLSHGTAKTMVESISTGTRVRRGGAIVALSKPPRRTMDFGSGESKAIGVGWGDVSTAYHSTGIPDITVYFEASKDMERMAGLGSAARWIMGTGPVQRFLKKQVERLPEGPTDEQRASSHAILIGEATDGAGNVVRTRLDTPEGYTLTAHSGLAIALRAANGDFEAGFQTPSNAYGADLILDFDGVTRADLNA
ncbi:saccharopine dehydrogenase NADP-binding domain-containing protein [Pyruvatibacter sp.]|uniref:saccharopine dehydrogenase family protein n=1 Tax=Pyruvatibacter sp. TaxID=1981328 RepID=UPI0032ED9361